MKVLLTGATGFIGGHVQRELERAGHTALPLSRKPGVGIDWSEGDLARGVEETDAVCHLSGENVFGRWTSGKKEAIRVSRVESTERLANLLAEKGTGVLVQSSAVGYYGDTGTGEIDEGSPQGEGFLAEVCGAWEAAAEVARTAGVRVCVVRTGVALGTDGGAFARMLLPFRLGLGGPIGHGKQPFPWVHVKDLARLYRFLLESESATGPFNGTSPAPVSSADFALTLGHVLRRPAFLPVPGFLLRLLFGEMADMLLTGQHALPWRTQETGFRFEHPELEGALRDLVA